MSDTTIWRHGLGDKVCDKVSGLTGIVMTRAEYLYGCARYWVQPQETKDGKPVDGGWFDEEQLESLQAGAIARPAYARVQVAARAPIAPRQVEKAGGPTDQPDPVRRSGE